LFSFFKKDKSTESEKPQTLKQRLIKSRQKLGSGLASLLLGKKSINDDLLDELEMLLITADIGINTTDKVLESVRKNASRKILKDSDGVYDFLKSELASLLVEDSQLNTDLDETFVILVVGVNGAGESLESVDLYSGTGFYYSPDPTNPHVNAAFQILEFNGNELIFQGVFYGDSLRLVPLQYP